jgi:N-acetylated-alpha-linked acidic dipeptidase
MRAVMPDPKGTAVFLPVVVFMLLSCAFTAAQNPGTSTGASPVEVQSPGPTGSGLRAHGVAEVAPAQTPGLTIKGFRDAKAEAELERRFLAVPDPKLAEQHLRAMASAPHVASTEEDRATAEYVADRFRAAGLETSVVEYRVWMNLPAEISVDVVAPAGVRMHGPSRERVDGDPYQDDPRILPAFNADSPSAELEADVVYANYGRPEDIQKLEQMGVEVRGKLLLVRYGQSYRGVKVLVAQEHGAAGVILYSDPADDGWARGDKYPTGPWRPSSAVQRGSVGYAFEFPGDPTTPGIGSSDLLSNERRITPDKSAAMPKIPCTPLSYGDAWPILENLGGPASPRDWQGALPFTYHVGPGPVRVRLRLKQDYAYRTIWDVIGRVRGIEMPDETVVAGNHRDAWVYGAADPGSGTAAMLEAAHGIGELLKGGWHPRRTIVMASWDAEESGLLGSTEWVEQNLGTSGTVGTVVAYFNTDIAVTGPNFGASAVPSLKQFVRDVAKAVPSPRGGTVYDTWREGNPSEVGAPVVVGEVRHPVAASGTEAPVGDLGAGSDFVPFLEHAGVPATDIGSTGPYGVYHSAFDDLAWFTKFGDPGFVYVQQMARVFGLEILRMSSADVLPFDYDEYGREIGQYATLTERNLQQKFGGKSPGVNDVRTAAARLERAGAALSRAQGDQAFDAGRLNRAAVEAERAFLIGSQGQGLPTRPWFRHAIYAPGRYTGYDVQVLPGVNDAVERGDLEQAREQLAAAAEAINHAAELLERTARKPQE